MRCCRLHAATVLAVLLAWGIARCEVRPSGDTGTTMLIDDFSARGGRSSLGTSWRTFTDSVMGGVSTGATTLETVEGRRCLRLRGEVSLENNGGFVQAALPLAPEGERLDASGFKGIRVTVLGREDGYFLHLRSRDTRLPWQYYAAPLPAGDSWREIEIPFSAFVPRSLRAALDASRLERVAIVAYGRAFTADLAVARIELYR